MRTIGGLLQDLLVGFGKTQRLHDGHHDVCIDHCLTDGTVQYPIERGVMCLLESRRVQKQKLRRFVRQNAGNAVAGRLRFIGGDADFLADKMIEQS